MEGLFDGTLDLTHSLLLVGCLLAALGFEFVNGFHDTANAVATVIYTKTLKPGAAVGLSGLCNFLGVLAGGIGVAMAIVHLLPVDLLIASHAGRSLAMILALLVAAIAWNLGTWYLALPASSSHTLIGAILGVGLANSLLEGHLGEGVNWHKAGEVGLSLLLSPVLGFLLSAGLLRLMRKLIKDKRVFSEPKEGEGPPSWVRGLLVLTCGGVSFTHGSNDGQKGVGLIMLILVGLLPASFALDPNVSGAALEEARAATGRMQALVAPLAEACPEERALPEEALHERARAEAEAPACTLHHELLVLSGALEGRSRIGQIPREERWVVRTALVRIADAVQRLRAQGGASAGVADRLAPELPKIEPLTDYAPWWVLAAVALALGVGTMVGWKRIVVTIGEKIGKSHLTYAQGASAEAVAMATIGLSSWLGLPVSTTHVLSSGVAGTMVAEGSGVQAATVKKIVWAWVLTLPASMLLSALLFVLFSKIAG